MVITKSSAILYTIYLALAGAATGILFDQDDIVGKGAESLLDEGITGIFILVLLIALYLAHKTNKDQAQKFQDTVQDMQKDMKELYEKEMEENAKTREVLTKLDSKLDERLPRRK